MNGLTYPDCEIASNAGESLPSIKEGNLVEEFADLALCVGECIFNAGLPG